MMNEFVREEKIISNRYVKQREQNFENRVQKCYKKTKESEITHGFMTWTE